MTQRSALYEVQDRVGLITLNNPDRRNVLSTVVLTAIGEYLGQIRDDRTVSVVIIRAKGQVFSSGHDLRELTKGTEGDYARVFALSTKVMEAVRLLPQPVIAQVQGLATALGCQLVAACDLAVAAEDAAFATPGVQIGLFCTTPCVALARAVSRKKAMEMLLTGTRSARRPSTGRSKPRCRTLTLSPSKSRLTTCGPMMRERVSTPFCRSARRGGPPDSRAQYGLTEDHHRRGVARTPLGHARLLPPWASAAPATPTPPCLR